METNGGSLINAAARAGVGALEHRVGDRMVIEVPRPRVVAGGAKQKIAFKARIVYVDGTPSVSIGLGWINVLVPTGVRTPLALSESSQYVVLAVTTDGRQVTSATIDLQDDPPDPPACELGAPPTSFRVPIAFVGPVDSPFAEQIVTRNLVAQRALCHQQARDPIPAGASPWINWFTWSVAEELQPQKVEM